MAVELTTVLFDYGWWKNATVNKTVFAERFDLTRWRCHAVVCYGGAGVAVYYQFISVVKNPEI